MQITPNEIKNQFARVNRDGWLPWFQETARLAKSSTAHFLALGSRETNLKNIPGDYRDGRYHGFGVLQVDIDTDPDYCRNWTPQNVEHGITRGGEIYLSKVKDTRFCIGKRSTCRSRVFTGRDVEADDLRRIATAAYNCGRWAHYHFSLGANVDSTTTGHDYSRDVYDRSIYFAALLEGSEIRSDEKDNLSVVRNLSLQVLEADALKSEIVLQGKYARDKHKALANIFYTNRVKLPAAAPMESQDVLAQVTFERYPVVPINEPAVPQSSATNSSLINAAVPQLQANSADQQPVQMNSSVVVAATTEGGDQLLAASASTIEPAGDAANAPPRGWINVQDWKPFVTAWLRRVWSGFTFTGFPQLGSFATFGVKYGGDYWWIYLLAGFLLFLFLLTVAVIASGVLGWIWYVNRKEINRAHALVAEKKADPTSFNLGLNVEAKHSRPLSEIIFGFKKSVSGGLLSGSANS